MLGSCHRDFRNRPYPFRARITYWGQRLRVSVNSGLTPRDPDEVCIDVGPLLLAPGGFFGVSAATSTLADDHDVLSFLTFSLSEPGPEVMPVQGLPCGEGRPWDPSLPRCFCSRHGAVRAVIPALSLPDL